MKNNLEIDSEVLNYKAVISFEDAIKLFSLYKNLESICSIEITKEDIKNIME